MPYLRVIRMAKTLGAGVTLLIGEGEEDSSPYIDSKRKIANDANVPFDSLRDKAVDEDFAGTILKCAHENYDLIAYS